MPAGMMLVDSCKHSFTNTCPWLLTLLPSWFLQATSLNDSVAGLCILLRGLVCCLRCVFWPVTHSATPESLCMRMQDCASLPQAIHQAYAVGACAWAVTA